MMSRVVIHIAHARLLEELYSRTSPPTFNDAAGSEPAQAGRKMKGRCVKSGAFAAPSGSVERGGDPQTAAEIVRAVAADPALGDGQAEPRAAGHAGIHAHLGAAVEIAAAVR